MTSLAMMSRTPSAQPAQRLSLGGLTISCGAHGRCLPPRQGALLLIPSLHPLSVHQDNLQQILRAPLDLLYLPAEATGLQTSAFQGWILSLDPEQLSQLAAELSGHHLSTARLRRRLQMGRPVQPRSTPQRELSETLQQLLHMVVSSPLLASNHLEMLGLDQAIQRLIVVLLCGDLIENARGHKDHERGGKTHIFDELLLWIQANLHRSIHLQDLVDQSGYSQRSLRNFFQERFGCAPVQWIRSRRLEAARERLLNPQPQDTVSSVAAAYGYTHLSQFSRDFQSAYQIKPSQLLREGLRGLSAD